MRTAFRMIFAERIFSEQRRGSRKGIELRQPPSTQMQMRGRFRVKASWAWSSPKTAYQSGIEAFFDPALIEMTKKERVTLLVLSHCKDIQRRITRSMTTKDPVPIFTE